MTLEARLTQPISPSSSLTIGDDKIQNFLYHLSQVSVPTPASKSSLLPGSSAAASLVSRREQAALAKDLAQDSAELLSSLKEIAVLFVTSSQFRLVLNQGVSLFAGIVADASGKVAEKASEIEGKARETGDDVRPCHRFSDDSSTS